MVGTSSRQKEMTGFLSPHVKKNQDQISISVATSLCFSAVGSLRAPFLCKSSPWLTSSSEGEQGWLVKKALVSYLLLVTHNNNFFLFIFLAKYIQQ